jgi:predicted amidohydrolase
MRDASRAGARLVHFPEGATCSPHKKIMSADGPDTAGPADWSCFRWDVLGEELAATARLAGELRLRTVLGSVHRLTPPHRPHNSLYVIGDRGRIATRYDERMLSSTKVTYLYAPGSAPVTFEVDGVSFGAALGTEAAFPEIFGDYGASASTASCSPPTARDAGQQWAAGPPGPGARGGQWLLGQLRRSGPGRGERAVRGDRP